MDGASDPSSILAMGPAMARGTGLRLVDRVYLGKVRPAESGPRGHKGRRTRDAAVDLGGMSRQSFLIVWAFVSWQEPTLTLACVSAFLVLPMDREVEWCWVSRWDLDCLQVQPRKIAVRRLDAKRCPSCHIPAGQIPSVNCAIFESGGGGPFRPDGPEVPPLGYLECHPCT